MRKPSASPTAPPRLRHDPSIPDVLRRDLRRAAATPPLPFDVAAAAARFDASLGVAAGDGGGVSVGAKSLGGTKWIAALVVVGALSGAVLFGTRSTSTSSPSQPPPARSSPPRRSVEAPAPPPAARRPEEAPAIPTISVDDLRSAPLAPPAPRALPPPPLPSASAPKSVRSSAFSASMLREETENLSELRRIAESDPARAVTFADEGHHRFAGGLLYQERESVAIRSLLASGREGEARARAERFLAAYPNGVAAERLRALLGTPDAP